MASNKKLIATAVAVSCLSSSAVLAQNTPYVPPPAPAAETPVVTEPVPVVEARHIPSLDIGATFGINNPGGIYGLDFDFRLMNRFSLSLAGGMGAWGPRISPGVRIYPFGIENLGLYFGPGLALNLGSEAHTTVNGVEGQRSNLLFTPALDLELGYRFQLGSMGWLALHAGYAIPFKGFNADGSPNNVTTSDGKPQDSAMRFITDAAQPGGIMAGISGGFSVL